jgi:preprotein translocase subunit SecA
MAGRGTDIAWDRREGSEAIQGQDADMKEINVMEIGGLHIIGSKRLSPDVSTGSCADALAAKAIRVVAVLLSLEDDLMRLSAGAHRGLDGSLVRKKARS